MLNGLCEKEVFKAKVFDSKWAHFIPNSNANGKSEAVNDCKAGKIESHSVLGPFFRISLIPYSNNAIQTKMITEPTAIAIKKIKYQKDYEKVTSDYQKTYGNYVQSLGKVMQTLMKKTTRNPNATSDVFRF